MTYLNQLYEKGTVNALRIHTDTLFTDEQAVFQFEGLLGKTMQYITDFQLTDAVHWNRFVNQFKIRSDSMDAGWRGEYWGKMMRGACFVYSCTRDAQLYRSLTETVRDMLTAMDELGRISSYSVEAEFHGWDIWCRKYVLLGMQYFMEICTDAQLKAQMVHSMKKQVDYMISKLGPKAEGKTPITTATNNWRGLNSSSLLEPVVRLYDLTGEKKYLDFAEYIVNEGGTSIANVFELAYEDKADPYQYPVTKAYELTSCFEGLLEYYRATGIEKYKQAVINFGRRLMKTDVTIIGSAGCTHELLDHSTVRQTDTSYTGVMQETCVTVTWMKFCVQLLMLTGDVAYADCFEQSLYNAYLGAVNTEKIVDTELIKKSFPDAIVEPLPFDSYSSLLPNTRGRGIGGLKLMPDQYYYGCCACIGSAGIGLLSKMALMLNQDGVVVNMYIPGSVSTRTPNGQALMLQNETAYPADGKVRLTLTLPQEEAFAITLRIPAWSEKNVLSVNGTRLPVAIGYTPIQRTWKNGDVIELELDMRARVMHPLPIPREIILNHTAWPHDYMVPNVLEGSPEAPYHIALRRGPLVLARDARLDGTVDEAVRICYDVDGVVDLQPSAKAGFDTITEFSVPQENGTFFTVIDYASAGKTWREDSKYACWLPTKEYWR